MGLAFGMAAMAQQRTVQNRPYTDLRPFHFGISVGSHVQDLEFVNSGEQTVVAENGTSTQQIISTDQDRLTWEYSVKCVFRSTYNYELRRQCISVHAILCC